MPNPRQRNIPVDKDEGIELERRKNLYEQKTGKTGDWGKALEVLTLGGLAALGIYALVKASKPTPTSWQVTCPNSKCRAIFPVATTGSPSRLAQIACPQCQTEMVVDFDATGYGRAHGVGEYSFQMSSNAFELNCRHCRQRILVQFPDTSPVAREFRCPLCGEVAEYGIGKAVET
jgi:DNA-directed RNA polymerase subunit RPC12/RpoP